MKLLILISLSILTAQQLHAQAPAQKPREFEEFIEAIPKQELLKLRGSKQNEAAVEISKKIGAAELHKDGTFLITADQVEPWQFPNDAVSGWRVMCKNERIKQGSVAFDLQGWIYVRQDSDKVLEKLRAGKKLIVTGKVSRADVTIIKGEPVLHVDIQATSLKGD